MKELLKRITNLLCIKSIVTLVLTAVFAYLSITGFVSPTEFVAIFIVVINFYFETQRNKKENTTNTENKEV